jgi:hypothetical protein
MKKLLLVMAVLLIAAPAIAEVKITCSRGSGPTHLDINEVAILYDATSEVNLPRAFALDITLTDTTGADNAVIYAALPTITGESAVGNRGYGIFLGADGVDINETTGIVNGWGSPVANPADPCAATGLGTNAITVELGSLYGGVQGVSNPNAPAKSGTLLTLNINRKICTVSVALNQRRGGIVMEDPAEVVDVNLPPAFTFDTEGADTCRFLYNNPPDNIVDSWDYNLVVNNWGPVPPGDPRADVAGFLFGPPNGTIDSWDLNYTVPRWGDWN